MGLLAKKKKKKRKIVLAFIDLGVFFTFILKALLDAIFTFSTLNISSHCLLASTISYKESIVNFTGAFLYKLLVFSAFKIFLSFSIFFCNTFECASLCFNSA